MTMMSFNFFSPPSEEQKREVIRDAARDEIDACRKYVIEQGPCKVLDCNIPHFFDDLTPDEQDVVVRVLARAAAGYRRTGQGTFFIMMFQHMVEEQLKRDGADVIQLATERIG